jgi:hypothetical protein
MGIDRLLDSGSATRRQKKASVPMAQEGQSDKSKKHMPTIELLW